MISWSMSQFSDIYDLFLFVNKIWILTNVVDFFYSVLVYLFHVDKQIRRGAQIACVIGEKVKAVRDVREVMNQLAWKQVPALPEKVMQVMDDTLYKALELCQHLH
ncbi:hypothetical protein YC2023_049403 [Brassica napus]